MVNQRECLPTPFTAGPFLQVQAGDSFSLDVAALGRMLPLRYPNANRGGLGCLLGHFGVQPESGRFEPMSLSPQSSGAPSPSCPRQPVAAVIPVQVVGLLP